MQSWKEKLGPIRKVLLKTGLALLLEKVRLLPQVAGAGDQGSGVNLMSGGWCPVGLVRAEGPTVGGARAYNRQSQFILVLSPSSSLVNSLLATLTRRKMIGCK